MRQATTEGRISPAKGMSGSHLPRTLVEQALAALRTEGHALTYAEGWQLVKRWRDQDAHAHTVDQFVAWTRRGDLIRCRPKPRASDPRPRLTPA